MDAFSSVWRQNSEKQRLSVVGSENILWAEIRPFCHVAASWSTPVFRRSNKIGDTMRYKMPPLMNQSLTAIRLALGWSQQELSQACGIPANLLSDYERGRKALSRQRLEQIAAAMGVPPVSVDTALAFVQTIRASCQTPGPADDPEDWHIESLASEAARLSADYTRSMLRLQRNGVRALRDRQQAEELWQRLKPRKTPERRLLVEQAHEFRNWALCEKVCEESVKAAGDSADRAVELAELALFIAERSPGDEAWRSRLQGYAWAHVGNARRVQGDLPSAEEAFGRSRRLWQAGGSADSSLLNEARLLDLEASFRRGQTRFIEALELLDRALVLDQGFLATRILLNKATILEALGNFSEAVATLHRAAPMVNAEKEPRLRFALCFNLAVNLCFLGQYGEAEELLPELRILATQIGNGLDKVRLRWLEGRIAAGCGRRERAIETLSNIREEFATRGVPHDMALASLELAVLYLEEGRTAEVKVIARQLAPIFQAQGVHREALVALKLFREAAEKEAVTLDFARRIVRYLQRAQYNPELRFEDL